MIGKCQTKKNENSSKIDMDFRDRKNETFADVHGGKEKQQYNLFIASWR